MLLTSFPRPALHYTQQTNSYGRFVMEPLPRGYGHTLGNSIRRTLLSSVPGIAVAAVEIDGITHEFAPLPGVAENVTEIILNLKELAVRGPSDTAREWLAHVSVDGPGEVTAEDIKLSRELTIVNPALHLATLTTPKARLEMTLRLETGEGYVPAERHDLTRWKKDAIPVDSIFSPVRRVAYQIEATRVGHETSFDRLVLQIWTNGAWLPEEVLRYGARTLIQSVLIFIEGDVEPLDLTPWETAASGEKVFSPLLDIPIEELDLSRRTYNCLKKEQIDTLAQLVAKSLEDLENIRGFGDRSLEEVVDKMKERGLSLHGQAEG